MTTLKLEQLGGMRPLLDARSLPSDAAADCVNVMVRSGVLRPLTAPTEVYRFVGRQYPTARAIYFTSGGMFWYPLQDVNSTIIRAPIVNDGFERFYILDPPGTPLRFNTRTRILAGQASYLLGLPAPTSSPTVGHSGGSATLKETRAYTYTYVDEYGQEGPPATPGVYTAPIDATSWNISGLVSSVPDAGQRPAVTKRIYRTLVADNGQVAYYFVANISLAATTYTDTASNAVVSLNYSLSTLNYIAPPPDLQGLIQMPGGFLVGWKGRDLHMSENYRPWAWPIEYDYALDVDIIGCGVVDQTLIIATSGNPHAMTGNSAAAMTASKLDRFEPCVSRTSIVSMAGAVLFASRNGLMSVNAAGVVDATKSLIGRDNWLRSFTPVYAAARTNNYYMALTEQNNGLGYLISFTDMREGVIRLQNFRSLTSIWNDRQSDDVHGLYFDGADSVVLRVTPADYTVSEAPQVFSWTSKEFVLAQPTNYGVLQVLAQGDPLSQWSNDVVAAVPPVTDPLEVFPIVTNLFGEPTFSSAQLHARIGATSLAGMCGIGRFGAYINEAPAKGTVPPGADGYGWYGWPYWPGVNSQLGRPPSTDLTLPDGEVGRVRVFSNRVQIYNEMLRPNRQVRLPSGFKSSVWQVMVTAIVPIYSIQMATHGKELASV